MEFFKRSEMPETTQVTRDTGSLVTRRLLTLDRALKPVMRTLLVLLAACSANEIAVSEPPKTAPTPVTHALPPISGVHGNAIATIGMTEDGLAAVSADRLGAMRLWPTLDGKVEPIVIAGQVPRALALARDPDGFTIADLDAAGDLELIRTSARGEVLGHRKVGGDDPVTRVVVVAADILVVRTDQAIELYDTHAVRKFRVVPEPSTHLVSIAARSGRVLALLSDDNVVRGRWLDVEHGAWGPVTPVLDIDPAHVVLSPDHHTIAAVSGKKKRKVFVDALTGKTGATWCSDDDDFERGMESFRTRPTIALGFTDEQTLACSISTAVTWWSTAGKALGNSSSAFTTATGDGRVIGGAGTDLQIMTPTTLQFLGYLTRQYAHFRVTPPGILVGKGEQTATVLDASFQPIRTITLPESKTGWLDIVPLDARYVLTLSLAAEPDDTGVQSARIALRDTSNGEVVELPFHVREQELSYDPVTRLLATTDGTDEVILRWDPMNARLSAPMRIAAPPSHAEAVAVAGWSVRKTNAPIVHLVDPALANGVVALVIHEEPGTLTVEELRDLKPGLTPVAARTYRLPGALLAVDRAGHVFVHNALESTAAVGYTSGLPTALLAEEASALLRPSPDGKLLAAYDGARLTLHDAATGNSRWEVSLWGLASVVWTMSGQLVAQFEGALATVDPTTGALGDRRCGWEFQLGDAVHESIAEAPNVCDVAP